jgi:hypothetical protein
MLKQRHIQKDRAIMKKFHEILYKNKAKRYSILTIIVGIFLYNQSDCMPRAANHQKEITHR